MVEWRTEQFRVLGSTNTYLKTAAERGEKEGLVVIAERQTEGRGRRGKSFYSPDKTGLYMSFLLRPSLPAQEALFITTAAAVALCRAIEKNYPHRALIKWVNDIYIGNKKAAGILTEASFRKDNVLDYVVVGIGVNISTESFPEEIKNIAVSLGKEDKRHTLATAILEEFSRIYEEFPSHSFFGEYRSRSILIGEEIEIMGEERRFGKVLDIDENCHLIVKLENNSIISLSSGEVSTRLKTV